MMLDKIAKLVSPYIPLGFAMKGLEKVDPRFKRFFDGAIAGGFTAESALDFIRDKIQPGEIDRLEDLSKRNTLRSDEKAGLSQLRKEQGVANAAATGAKLGAGGLGGLLASGLLQDDTAYASEISRMQPREKQKQLLGPSERKLLTNQEREEPRIDPKRLTEAQKRLLLTEQLQPGIPEEGSVISPPPTRQQSLEAAKRSALLKANEKRKKMSMLEQERQRFEQGYGQEQQDDPYAIIREAMQRLQQL